MSENKILHSKKDRLVLGIQAREGQADNLIKLWEDLREADDVVWNIQTNPNREFVVNKQLTSKVGPVTNPWIADVTLIPVADTVPRNVNRLNYRRLQLDHWLAIKGPECTLGPHRIIDLEWHKYQINVHPKRMYIHEEKDSRTHVLYLEIESPYFCSDGGFDYEFKDIVPMTFIRVLEAYYNVEIDLCLNARQETEGLLYNSDPTGTVFKEKYFVSTGYIEVQAGKEYEYKLERMNSVVARYLLSNLKDVQAYLVKTYSLIYQEAVDQSPVNSEKYLGTTLFTEGLLINPGRKECEIFPLDNLGYDYNQHLRRCDGSYEEEELWKELYDKGITMPWSFARRVAETLEPNEKRLIVGHWIARYANRNEIRFNADGSLGRGFKPFQHIEEVFEEYFPSLTFISKY